MYYSLGTLNRDLVEWLRTLHPDNVCLFDNGELFSDGKSLLDNLEILIQKYISYIQKYEADFFIKLLLECISYWVSI